MTAKLKINYNSIVPPGGAKKYFALGIAFLILSVAVGLIVISSLQSDLPSLAQLHNIQPSLITKVYDRNGELLKEFYQERRILVSFNEIPPYLIDCLLATEDRRFYSHWGIDLKRIFGATASNILKMDLTAEGASTITQQLARKLFLTPEKNYIRKIKEALTAIKIENTYSKNEILQLYLNQNYFGRGAYGIQAAAQTYFAKDARDLTLSDCALLIGLLKAPNRYSPVDHPDRALRRRNIVFESLASWGKISKAMVDSLKQEPLTMKLGEGDYGRAPYFTEMVRQFLYGTYGEDALYSSGLTIYTTLDWKMQESAEKALFSMIDNIQGQIQSNYDLDNENYTLVMVDSTSGRRKRVYKQIQGMLMAMDNETGGVLAFCGGRDFETSKFIRVTQALRQPGSAFKPFVYTVAMDNGFTPTDMLLDSPMVLEAGGKEWRPNNFDEEFRGEMTLREGLRDSRNLIAIKLIMDPKVTPQRVVEYANKMGIRTKLTPVPSIAVGSSEVLMWDMVPSFAVFSNGGIYRAPYYITKVVDRYGHTIYENPRQEQKEVLTAQTSYIMTNMLQSVVDYGTGAGARRIGFSRPAAGKTGTSNDNTDNWFVGFIPQITCGVWIGFDDKTKIGIGKGEVGATTALPVWTQFMMAATDTIPVRDFPVPPGIFTATICLDSRELASPKCKRTATDIFTETTFPRYECSIHGRR